MRISSAGHLGLLLVVCLQSASCGGDEPPAGSAVVMAAAGSDRTVAKGSLVTLDGTDSRAAGPMTYAWTLSAPGGSAALLRLGAGLLAAVS